MSSSTVVPCTWIEDLHFDWTPYTSVGKRIHLPENRYLYHYRQTRHTVYAVVEGRVRLSLSTENGEEKTFLVVGKNGLLGEAGLYDGDEHVTNAIANVDCILYAFSYPIFRKMLQSSPKLSEFCIANLGRKLQILTIQSMELTYMSAQHRVIRSLLELAGTYGTHSNSGVQISVRFTQQEMASVVGVSRVTIAQIFHCLSEQGLLKRSGRHYILTNPNQLNDMLTRHDRLRRPYR